MYNHGLTMAASDKDNAAALRVWAEDEEVTANVILAGAGIMRTAAREITTQKRAVERWRAVQDE